MERIKINEIIIVEGKYDKILLSQFIDTVIVETAGFRIFNDVKKRKLISELAKERGVVILTDSDSAGFVIRNYIKGFLPPVSIKNAYIPRIEGKEKRKSKPSKEGILGVEGINREIILKCLENSGVTFYTSPGLNSDLSEPLISRLDLYSLGLTGGKNSSFLRMKIMKHFDLPSYLSTKAFLDVVNILCTRSEFISLAGKISEDEEAV